jgi:hypothetical protein
MSEEETPITSFATDNKHATASAFNYANFIAVTPPSHEESAKLLGYDPGWRTILTPPKKT